MSKETHEAKTPDPASPEAATPAATPAPKPAIRIGGLGRKAQKLQAAREKAAQLQNGAKPSPRDSVASFKAKDSFANTKKTTFQRKAV